MPTPEDHAAARQAERAAKYPTEVARLRALCDREHTDTDSEEQA